MRLLLLALLFAGAVLCTEYPVTTRCAFCEHKNLTARNDLFVGRHLTTGGNVTVAGGMNVTGRADFNSVYMPCLSASQSVCDFVTGTIAYRNRALLVLQNITSQLTENAKGLASTVANQGVIQSQQATLIVQMQAVLLQLSDTDAEQTFLLEVMQNVTTAMGVIQAQQANMLFTLSTEIYLQQTVTDLLALQMADLACTLTGGQIIVASISNNMTGNQTQMVFDYIDDALNVNNSYNASTGEFTSYVGGYYTLNVQIMVQWMDLSDYGFVKLWSTEKLMGHGVARFHAPDHVGEVTVMFLDRVIEMLPMEEIHVEVYVPGASVLISNLDEGMHTYFQMVKNV